MALFSIQKFILFQYICLIFNKGKKSFFYIESLANFLIIPLLLIYYSIVYFSSL